MATIVDTDVAVVGTGALGVAFTCSLRHALQGRPVSVTAFEKQIEAGRGNAFYDPTGSARLNVESDEMHLVPELKGEFRAWLAGKGLLGSFGDWHLGGLAPRMQFSIFIREKFREASVEGRDFALKIETGIKAGNVISAARSTNHVWVLTTAD